jgi:hypothetical protein
LAARSGSEIEPIRLPSGLRILRTAISEVIVRRDGAIIHAVLHWQGGDHTELQVKQRLNAAGRHNPRIPDDTIALMRELTPLIPDRQIARLLNRIGIATGYASPCGPALLVTQDPSRTRA